MQPEDIDEDLSEELLEPDGPPEPVHRAQWFDIALNVGAVVVLAGGGIFALATAMNANRTHGASRSVRIEYEHRQDLIEQQMALIREAEQNDEGQEENTQ